MANVEFITAPIGSQFTQAIGTDDPESLNDFQVFCVFSENVTGLSLDNFTLTARLDNTAMTDISDDASLVSLDGENSVWVLTIRPPHAGTILTLTLLSLIHI